MWGQKTQSKNWTNSFPSCSSASWVVISGADLWLRTSKCNHLLEFQAFCISLLAARVVVVWWISCVGLFWDLVNYSPPGSTVHGILQARILEWVMMPSSRGSSRCRGDRTRVSCIDRRVLYHWVTKEATIAHDTLNYNYLCICFCIPSPHPTFWSLQEHNPHCIAWHSTYRYSVSACWMNVYTQSSQALSALGVLETSIKDLSL